MSERRCELCELTDIEEHSVKAAENEKAEDEPHKGEQETAKYLALSGFLSPVAEGLP